MTSPSKDESGPLKGRFICLEVSGAIAAYKAAALTSRLFQHGAEVQVIMTASALRFVGELTFETLSHRPVITDLWSRSAEWDPQHVALARKTDAFVVAPATANIMAKCANGVADDALSTALLTMWQKPLFFAPAMNTRMWLNPATKRNVAELISRGATIIGPESGPLACRDEDGPGRMSEPDAIVDVLSSFFGMHGDRLK